MNIKKLTELTDRAKHVLYEDNVPSNTEIPSATIGVTPQIVVTSMSRSTVISSDDSIYQGLYSKTRPEDYPNLSKVVALTKPLERVIPDPMLRVRSAVAQVASNGITVQMILGDVTDLKKALEVEISKGSQSLVGWKKEMIDGKEASVANLEAQLSQLKADLNSNKEKIRSKEEQFKNAAARRAAEIDELANQFKGL